MALSGLVWNYSHTGWCGFDQAQERRTHGGLGGKGKHQIRQAQCTPKTSHHGRSAADPLTLFYRQLTCRRGEMTTCNRHIAHVRCP